MKTLIVHAALGLAVVACGCGDKSKSGSDSDGKSKTGTSPKSTAAAQPTPLTAVQRITLRNNLKQLMIVMHHYLETHRQFPAGAGDHAGKGKGLSWRVHILPFLGKGDLYQRFHLNEPWDSPHNRSLLAEMPKEYKTPGVDTEGMTTIRAFAGPGTVLGEAKGIHIARMTDGSTNTAIVIAAGPERAVEWTKPELLNWNTSQSPSEILGAIADTGIGGLTAAAALLRQGFRVRVLETVDEFRPVGAGITIQMNAMQALREIGLSDAVAQSGNVLNHLAIRFSSGKSIVRSDMHAPARKYGVPFVAIHRAQLQQVLAAAAGHENIVFGFRVQEIAEEGERIVVKSTDGRLEQGDLLIGADGIRSRVRAHLWGDEPLRYSGYTSWRGVTETQGRIPIDEAVEAWGGKSVFGMMPFSSTRLYWFATDRIAADGKDAADPRETILALVGDWCEPVRSLVESTPPEAILRTDIYDRPPRFPWGRGRITLLGDAAHAMTPNLGQGGGQAIEDGVILARILGRAESVADGLRAYERRRRSRTDHIVNTSFKMSALAHGKTPMMRFARRCSSESSFQTSGFRFVKIPFKNHLKQLLVIPPLAVGVIVLFWLVQSRGEPTRKPEEEEARVLRVVKVTEVDVVPRATAYGTSQPGKVWQVVAEVRGRVVEVHRDLKPGALMKKDAVALRIDPTEYQLAVDRLTEELNQSIAQGEELEAQSKNYAAQLKLEERTLAVARKELARLQTALKNGAVNQADVDVQERAVLTQELKSLSVKNAANLLPSQKKSVAALVAVKRKALEQAEEDLKKTKIVVPFDCRIGPVNIQVSQFLAAGQKLFEGDGIAVTEVEAQVTPRQIQKLIGVKLKSLRNVPLPKVSMETMREIFRVTAVVRYQIGPTTMEWPAKFARVREVIDPTTQTVGMIVAIEKPYENAIPGERHPPLKGMFCEVELRGVARPGRIVIPRSAVRENRVYVVNKENRLATRNVTVEMNQGNVSVIADGLKAGDLVVVSEPGRSMIGFFARHKTAANLLMIVFFALGIFALPQLQRETFPDITPAIVQVRVVYPGASTAEIEESICQRIEDAVDGVKFVKEVVSEARDGVAVVTIEMEDGADFREFKDDIRTEIDAIDDLPDDAEDPIIKQIGLTDAVMTLIVSAPTTPAKLKEHCEGLKRRLKQLEGVSLVDVRGFSDRQLRIELSALALKQHNLSVDDVASAVSRQSVGIPAGEIETNAQTLMIRFVEERRTPAQLESLVVKAKQGGAEVRLGALGRVVDVFEVEEDKVLLGDRRAGMLVVEKTKNQDILRVADRVKTFLDGERERFPQVNVEITNDLSVLVDDRLNMLIDNFLQGLVLVFITLWLFFNFRLSFWVAMGLPVSAFGAFFVMPLIGQTVNMLTMISMLLALGLLMDDAIVIAENIAAHLARGKPAMQSAIDGVSEVGIGVLSSFLTTTVVLGPLAFIDGDIGKVLRVVPLVLIVILAVSLIEAFLILPAHLGHSLGHAAAAAPGGFRRSFDAGIDWIRESVVGRSVDFLLRWRYLWVGSVAGMLLISVGMLAGGVLKMQAFPDLEGDTLVARLRLPAGTPLERTEAVVSKITGAAEVVNRHFAERQPDGRDVVRLVSVEFNRNDNAYENGPHVATVQIELLSTEIRNARIDDIIKVWREAVGDVPDIVSLTFSQPVFGPAGRPIEVRLRGNDLDELAAASEEMRAWIAELKGTRNLSIDLHPGKPEIRMSLKPGALGLGLDAATMARQLNAAFSGVRAKEIQVGTESFEIEAQLDPAYRSSIADLENFHFTTPGGTRIPLDAVLQVETDRGWSRIARVDGMRTATVRGDLDAREIKALEVVGQLRQKFLPGFEKKHPRLDVSFEGEVREGEISQASMTRGAIIGVIGVFLILSFQFQSYLEPIVVMLAIPMAAIGVVWGHLLLGYDFTNPSLLGFIALSGVVVNDSILLVQFLKERIDAGDDVLAAAGQASRLRFRAIALTSLTTIAGLLPLMAERSVQAQVLIPLALSIAFGLLTSTVLVLLVVPCLYAILADFGLTSRIADKITLGLINFVIGFGAGWLCRRVPKNDDSQQEPANAAAETVDVNGMMNIVDEIDGATADQQASNNALRVLAGGERVDIGSQLGVHIQANRHFTRLLKTYRSELQQRDPEKAYVPEQFTDSLEHSMQAVSLLTEELVTSDSNPDHPVLELLERLEHLEESNAQLRGEVEFAKRQIEQQSSRLELVESAAFEDFLTKLPNRRAHERRFAELKADLENGVCEPFCMLLIDLDHFKAVNDTHGHECGDAVLSVVAHVLRDVCRGQDHISRHGGEEFVVLATETDLDGASILAERLRSRVESTATRHAGIKVKITCSIGIAKATSGTSADQLFQCADAALYDAKEAGRNRYVVYDEAREPSLV
eukprot:g8256.t1